MGRWDWTLIFAWSAALALCLLLWALVFTALYLMGALEWVL